MEKGEIARNEQFLLFPQCFQELYCRHIKTRACLGKGLDRMENIVEKGVNISYQHFLFFPLIISKDYFLRVDKSRFVW